MQTFDNIAQRSEQWFNARRGIPTCSRFDKIVTPSKGEPSKSQNGLINELIAESICPPDQGLIKPAYTSPEMEHGMIMEAEARCRYEFDHAGKLPIKETGFILHDSGKFGGSPDCLVGDEGGAELKCPQPATHIGYIRESVLPPIYRAQVHGYLVVTGRKWWGFFSYARNFPPFHVRVERDQFTEILERELMSFVVRYNAEREKFGLQPIGNK